MNKKIVLASIPLLGLLLAGCGQSEVFTMPNGKTVTCEASSVTSGKCSSGGKTVSFNPATAAPSSSAPAPAPATSLRSGSVPVASTPGQANIPGASAPTVNTQAAVSTCLGNAPSTDTLVELTQNSGVQKLSICLALSPQETSALIALLVQDAIQAQAGHVWQTQSDRTTWTQTVVTSDVTRCRNES